jgi:hypothetical protein
VLAFLPDAFDDGIDLFKKLDDLDDGLSTPTPAP